MPIKSENKQGNPYHDEEGKFTSSDNNSEEQEAMKLFGLQTGSRVIEKKDPRELEEQAEMERRVDSDFDNFFDPDVGMDKDGYKEKMSELPSGGIPAEEPDDEHDRDYYLFNDYTIDYDTNDVVNYFKSKGVELSDEDIYNIGDGVVPTRIFEDYFDQDEFEDFVRKNHRDSASEVSQNIKENKEFTKDPDAFYGLKK